MKYLGIYLRGLAMGAADVVPGVSGGTIAFITGIYDELIESIKSVNFASLKALKNEGIGGFWQHINGTFLLSLGLGIISAIALLASAIGYLLETYPQYLWSFFFGLILASSVVILRQVTQWRAAEVIILISGIVISSFISLSTPTSIQATPLIVFLAGSIAICAMILPGISGSFILLLMGLYVPILGAVKNFEITTLVLFLSGAAIGLGLFVRLLSWILKRFPNLLLSLLTGFMLGALFKVWPWKETISTRINSKGEAVPFIQENRLPDSSSPETLALCLLMFVLAILLVWLLEVKSKR